MRGRNFKGSTMVQGRQYAIGVEGTTITYECERAKHTYKINHGSKRLAVYRRLSEAACRMMAGWWSREKGGCIGECPKCEKEGKPNPERIEDPPRCPRCGVPDDVAPARNYGREVKPRRWWCMKCGWLSA